MNSELIAHTPIFDLVKLDEVQTGFRPVAVQSKDWATMIAFDGDDVYTVSQLRYGRNMEFTELPCGIVEDSEDPKKAAIREFEEETGIHIIRESDVIHLGSLAANPAFMTNRMHYYFIRLNSHNYEKTMQKLDEHEKISVRKMPFHNFSAVLELQEGSAIMGGGMWLLLKYLAKQFGM